jgi:hypothetical protein
MGYDDFVHRSDQVNEDGAGLAADNSSMASTTAASRAAFAQGFAPAHLVELTAFLVVSAKSYPAHLI